MSLKLWAYYSKQIFLLISLSQKCKKEESHISLMRKQVQRLSAANITQGGCLGPNIPWNKRDASIDKSLLPDPFLVTRICPPRGRLPITAESVRFLLPAPILSPWQNPERVLKPHCLFLPALPEAGKLGSSNDSMQRLLQHPSNKLTFYL